MRNTLALSWLLLGALVAPVVMGGSASSPELTDASGDAAGAVDVTAGWFTKPGKPAVSTGNPDVDCLSLVVIAVSDCSTDRFRVVIQVRDLLAAAPLADEDPLSTRYVYEISFTPSNSPERVTVVCMINYADVVAVGFAGIVSPNLDQVGRFCRIPADGTPGDAYDVDGFNVDRVTNTISVTMSSDLVLVGPGVTFSDLSVKTYVGGWVTSPNPRLGPNNLADTTGAGAAWTF